MKTTWARAQYSTKQHNTTQRPIWRKRTTCNQDYCYLFWITSFLSGSLLACPLLAHFSTTRSFEFFSFHFISWAFFSVRQHCNATFYTFHFSFRSIFLCKLTKWIYCSRSYSLIISTQSSDTTRTLIIIPDIELNENLTHEHWTLHGVNLLRSRTNHGPNISHFYLDGYDLHLALQFENGNRAMSMFILLLLFLFLQESNW